MAILTVVGFLLALIGGKLIERDSLDASERIASLVLGISGSIAVAAGISSMLLSI